MKFNNLLNVSFVALSIFAASCASPEGKEVKTETAQKVEQTAETAKAVKVALADSKINWEGAKPTGTHVGFLNLSSGELMFEEKNLVGGKFTLDMTSITTTDLEGEKKTDLEGHLKNQDFFEVEKFPTGNFEITKVEEAKTETSTHKITGNLTLKGITKSIEVPAKVKFENGAFVAKTPKFTIDRTEWNIVYKSSKVGDMAINDKMSLQINIQTEANF